MLTIVSEDCVKGGTHPEIWLWDFAGQADYRLIHQLYMDETALAVLVFNPQSENPFEGLGQWDHDLMRAARRPFQKLLVAGRCDRGDEGTLLVFPSYFRRERPELEDYPAVLVSYQFSGALDEIYATLVVRLHHTVPFDTDQLWRFAIDFKTPVRQTGRAEDD